MTIAAPGGLKMDLAKKLEAGDEYVELSRSNPEEQFEKIKKDNPYGEILVSHHQALSKLIRVHQGSTS